MPLPAAPAVRTRETHPLSRFLLAGLLRLAGLGHFVIADALVTIVPAAVPFARAIVLLTGLFELLAAVLLLVPSKKLRALAAIGLALYAVAVYPANIQHMLNDLASRPAGWGSGTTSPGWRCSRSSFSGRSRPAASSAGSPISKNPSARRRERVPVFTSLSKTGCEPRTTSDLSGSGRTARQRPRRLLRRQAAARARCGRDRSHRHPPSRRHRPRCADAHDRAIRPTSANRAGLPCAASGPSCRWRRSGSEAGNVSFSASSRSPGASIGRLPFLLAPDRLYGRRNVALVHHDQSPCFSAEEHVS